jgi:type I restriction enzyme R subunit
VHPRCRARPLHGRWSRCHPSAIDATAPLREEIESLRRRVAESEDAASRARREAEDHARARESVEQKLAREAEERAIWERLAAESENKTAEIASRLAALQAAAEHAPRAESLELIQRGEEASTKIDLDEAATRALIDQQLRDSGWEADTKTLRHGTGARPVKGRNLAIAEWPTASGPADYALFGSSTLLGVVEAKRKRKNVSAAYVRANINAIAALKLVVQRPRDRVRESANGQFSNLGEMSHLNPQSGPKETGL